MLTRTGRRAGTAVALAVALLVVTAPPAAATPANGVLIEPSSTISIHPSTGGASLGDVHVQGHTTTSPCTGLNSLTPSPIPVSFPSNGNGTIGATSTGWHLFTVGANSYKVRLNIATGTIGLSGAGTTVTLTVNAEFRACNSQTALCTTNNFNITMTGPSVGHHPEHSTKVTVTGTSTHITVPLTCNAILRSVLTSSHAVAALNLHFDFSF